MSAFYEIYNLINLYKNDFKIIYYFESDKFQIFDWLLLAMYSQLHDKYERLT